MDMSGKGVLVTGGSGFIGKNLIERLLSEGAKVISISRGKDTSGVQTINADLTKTDFSFIDSLDFDYAVHLAGFSSPRRSINEQATLELNAVATDRLFYKLMQKGIKKAVFMSSCTVYSSSDEDLREDSPLEQKPGIYVKSKLLAEESCRKFQEKGFPLVIFRLSNAYGPHQQWKKEDTPTLIPQIISDVLINKSIEVYNGSPVRDYVYVDDVSEAIVLALKSNAIGTFNLGTGVGTSVAEIANEISGLVAAPLTFLNKEVSGPNRIVLDISKIKSVFGWTSYHSIKDGLRRTLNYYQEVIHDD